MTNTEKPLRVNYSTEPPPGARMLENRTPNQPWGVLERVTYLGTSPCDCPCDQCAAGREGGEHPDGTHECTVHQWLMRGEGAAKIKSAFRGPKAPQDAAPGELAMQTSPGSTTLLSILTWVLSGVTLQAISGQESALVELVRAVAAGGWSLPDGTAYQLPDRTRRKILLVLKRLEAAHAAQVYEGGSPLRVYPVDASRHTVRTVVSLMGSHPDLYERKRKGARGLAKLEAQDAEPEVYVFSWDDGTQQQLNLPLDGDAMDSPLLVVGRHYGDAAVRDLLGLYLFAWAARSGPRPFWWWPDEHLEWCGMARNKDNRRKLVAMMTRLSKTKLETRFRNGAPLIGPIVSMPLTDKAAYQVGFHPAMYSGIEKPDGTPGGYSWPVPLEVLQLPAGQADGRVHTLSVVLGGLFRADLRRGGSSPSIEVQRLADCLGIRGRQDRAGKHDDRMEKGLSLALAGTVKAGVLDRYECSAGGLSNPQAVVTLYPGRLAVESMATRRMPERPARVPATGAELATFLLGTGQSAAELARKLDLPERTVRHVARTYAYRPIPPQVRVALTACLWKRGEQEQLPAAIEGGGIDQKRQ